jgi:transcriptional regulator with XRE-family HTH domain
MGPASHEASQGKSEETAVLLSAVSGLAPFAPAERVVRALRRALVELLAASEAPAAIAPPRPFDKGSGDPRSPRPNRDRYTNQPSLELWLPLRDRVLAELAASGMSRRELAGKLGISLSGLKAGLAPRCRIPGEAHRAKLAAWLEREAKSNGASEPAPGASGLPAYRLSTEQRERLAGYRQLDERATRKMLGMTQETVEAAIAGGRDLAPEIVAKLATFLERQQPGG